VNAPRFGLSDVYARADRARVIMAGTAAELPAASDLWEEVDRSLADVPAMGAVIARLSDELAATRMDRANLLAAMRAASAADADGEADPLYYVRDELGSRQGGSQGRRRAS
jgi:hypothetical protein